MAPVGYFILNLAKLLNAVLWIFMWIIVARAVLSWVNPDPFNPVVRFIHKVTEPVLRPIRQRLPLAYGGIDFSPMIVFVAIMFLRLWVIPRIAYFGAGFLQQP